MTGQQFTLAVRRQRDRNRWRRLADVSRDARSLASVRRWPQRPLGTLESTPHPGVRLGSYEILSPLGAGGMGEVYKARDTKLGRDVAIKILPDAFVSDPERVARFQREARTLASLNHPNIGGIHGLEESGGVTALVMELVEGEDLSQRIARGAIPIDEALPHRAARSRKPSKRRTSRGSSIAI